MQKHVTLSLDKEWVVMRLAARSAQICEDGSPLDAGSRFLLCYPTISS
jgi:hypothetical protein